ncbi:SUMO1 sentrin specific peptidase 8 [Homalodisca vitripennis]|nr:SUMO1 sentrin specific peptidase 8 [Homalodisca vitripennis]
MENLKHQPGDLVIAKLKGHAPWPAVIENVEKKGNTFIFNVIFYGSKEKGTCRLSELSSYTEQKHKIPQDKKQKNEVYALAFKEIEDDLRSKQRKHCNRGSLKNHVIPPVLNKTTDFPSPQPKAGETPTNNLLTPKNKATKHQNVKIQTQLSHSVHNMETNTCNRFSICMSIMESKYITDDSIELYYNMLTAKIVKQEILLMNPVVTQAIKCLEDTNTIVEPLQIQNKSFIFFPISDSPAIDQVGGSHWSLLLYVKGHDEFLYFDSIGDYNLSHAKQVVKKISKHLGLGELTPINKVAVPQQSNGVDCGIYMLIFGDILIQCIIKGTIYEIKNNRGDFWPDIKESDILTKRAQLALLLHNNNFTTLRPDTVAEMMYQMPIPTPTQDLLGYSALEGSIDHTPVSCTADSNININKNCRYNMDKNATNLRKWNEVKKRKGN